VFTCCFKVATLISEGAVGVGAFFGGCTAFRSLLAVEATVCVGLGLCESWGTLIVSGTGSAILAFDLGTVLSSGIRRFMGSFFAVFAVFKTNSSSEGTSNMSALVLVGRDLPSDAPLCVSSACLFPSLFVSALFLRGRSGDGASLFEADAATGAGIVVRREALLP
jgi:hypothetical protein